jgi:hypothetical protein
MGFVRLICVIELYLETDRVNFLLIRRERQIKILGVFQQEENPEQ